MFRKEKTVPKMSFASSSALRIPRAGGPPLTMACEEGLEPLPDAGIVGGSQRLL